MTNKILIAEDEIEFKNKYESWASNLGYEIIGVSRMDEAIARLDEVDAVITDYGLEQGNGNDLARMAKEHGLPVAGITGGSKSIFDENYVDIPETKRINQGNFATLVECLFQKKPREKYQKRTLQELDTSLPEAASVLFQGYYFAKALREGLEEISVNGKVVVTKENMKKISEMAQKNIEDPINLFNFYEENNINPQEVLEISQRINPELKKDTKLIGIFNKLIQGNYNLTIDDALYATETIIKKD
tara:strand:- start:11963 stop:12700 length:738 start_codon:yes stop_codon:yes gene_type:complete